MRRQVLCLAIGAAVMLGAPAARGTTLEERKNEWAFALTAVDTDDVGTFTQYTFDWSWIFSGGYHQLGVSVSAFDNDFDDPLLADVDGSSIGPTYQFNWTPKKERATGFLFANVSSVGGDLGDVFDSTVSLGVGVKAFVGNSAAIGVFYAFDKLQGASGFDDVDQRRLAVAIALYSHKR